MLRTTLMLPVELKLSAEKHARSKRWSLGELIRDCLRKCLEEDRHHGAEDSFFADTAMAKVKTPRDLAANHDVYLDD